MESWPSYSPPLLVTFLALVVLGFWETCKFHALVVVYQPCFLSMHCLGPNLQIWWWGLHPADPPVWVWYKPPWWCTIKFSDSVTSKVCVPLILMSFTQTWLYLHWRSTLEPPQWVLTSGPYLNSLGFSSHPDGSSLWVTSPKIQPHPEAWPND